MISERLTFFYLRLEEMADEIYQIHSTEEKELSLLLGDLSKVLYDFKQWKLGDAGEEKFKKTFNKFKKKWIKETTLIGNYSSTAE